MNLTVCTVDCPHMDTTLWLTKTGTDDYKLVVTEAGSTCTYSPISFECATDFISRKLEQKSEKLGGVSYWLRN